MTQNHLSIKYVAIAPGANQQVYERDGAIIGTAPIQEFTRFVASGLGDNQTAIFDLDKSEIDFVPLYILANFIGTAGNITLTIKSIKDYGNIIFSLTINGSAAQVGYLLPEIPITHRNATLEITTAKACNYIWISAKQIAMFSEISQDRII
jgi:hypothetical protein